MNQDEHHVLTTIETILARKKIRKIWKDVDRSYGNSWGFKKNVFESNLKRKHNIAFLNTSDFGWKCNEWLIGSHLM
jgi:hypothetical protein